MKKIFLIAGFLAPVLLAATTVGAQEKDNDFALKARIDSYLGAGVENGFSGAILVAKEERIIINKGYGLADKSKNILNNSATVFDIGSNTKQFTGAAILKLVQANKVQVTDSLSTFFDELPDDKKKITVHQLLTHSAGFVESIGRDFDAITQEQFFQQVFASELLHEPGSKYAYSNIGYSILARIIELVSGQDYESFLNDQLFKPAGMEHTGYLKPDWDAALLARGYNRNIMDQGSMVTRYREDGSITWHLKGNGGINSTQDDMYKWFKALKFNKVLPKPLFEKLTTAYIGPDGSSYKYGYGWGVSKSEVHTKRLSHNGSNGVFSHSLIWLPEDDIVIIYVTNTSSPRLEDVGRQIEKMVFDGEYRADAITKNPYLLVFDFMEHNAPEKAQDLLAYIQKDYSSEFENSVVLNRVGYMVLQTKENLDWAVELFKLNAQLFADDGNVWDSLGDGYLANGQKIQAIESFEKAVALNREGSLHKLNELRASVQ